MNVIPAKIAGVKEIIMITPPPEEICTGYFGRGQIGRGR